MTAVRGVAPVGGLIWLVTLLAASLLGFEVSLMRVLLVAGWHHFAFLLISVALLGFGASGTALYLSRRWVCRHAAPALVGLALATAATMPICTGLAQHVAIEMSLAPALLGGVIGRWLLYWALLTVPFFLGAAALGLALMTCGGRVATVYAGNLLGSAAGALAAPLLMTVVSPAWLPLVMGCGAALAAAGAGSGFAARRSAAIAGCAAAVGLYLWLDPPHVRLDEFKRGSQIQRLAAQDDVERVGRVLGPRAVLEAYRGRVLHDIPFLGVGQDPPAVSVVLADGHWVGSVLEIKGADESGIVEGLLMSSVYDLAPQRPRVALLGETGGLNIWLAARHAARAIDVVQPDRRLTGLLRGPLREFGGAVLDLPNVRIRSAEPRHFIEHTHDSFDVIQLAMTESSAAGSGGIGGLAHDHLLTIEGLTTCLLRLEAQGLLAVGRAIQSPPRDNLKLLATLVEALRSMGVVDPSRNVVILRDYLAVLTIVKPTPFSDSQIERVRAICRDRQLTPVWFRGVQVQELNRPDSLPGPAEGPGDWLHHAAGQLFGPAAGRFIDEWAFDVRPPTDDRPFFSDFCRLASIEAMKDAYGDLWLTRTELAYLFVLAAAVSVTVAATAMILPLALVRVAQGRRGGWATAAYFGCLGLGYLLLEMTFLAHLTVLIGDSVLAAAVTIGGFLFFSGLGSLASSRLGRRRARSVRWIILCLVSGALVETIGLRYWEAAAGLTVAGRLAVGLGLIAPLAFAMGFPMPMGLTRLAGGTPGLIAWAWGANGFASVLAAPLAMVLAMTWGYHITTAFALAAYLAAGLVFGMLPGSQPASWPTDRS